MLQIMQRHNAWMLNRVPLSTEIHGRWVPGAADVDTSPTPPLTFVRSLANLENWMGLASEKTVTFQENHLQEQSPGARQTTPSIRAFPQDLAGTNDLLITRSLAHSVADSGATGQDKVGIQSSSGYLDAPSATEISPASAGLIEIKRPRREPTLSRKADMVTVPVHLSAEPAIQSSSRDLDAPSVAAIPIVSPGQIEINQPRREMALSRKDDMVTVTVRSSSAAKPYQTSTGVTLVQRSANDLPEPGIQPMVSPPANAQSHTDSQVVQISERGVSPQLFQHRVPTTPLDYPVQRIQPTLQRALLSTLVYSSHRSVSALPLARPIQVQLSRAVSTGLIQSYATDIHPVQSPVLFPLIQRQSSPTEAPMTPISSNSITPPSAPASAEQGPDIAIDIEKISEEIIQIIMDQIAVERERRGINV